MCGIAGFFDSSLISSVKKELGSKMLQRIRHRGPDASSAYIDDQVCLGHNRLSIIDLSVEADQPFVVDQWVMVYNGEVYNYVEIRNELQALGHKFRTASDTEVILKSFIQWGDTCVDRFVGMWAFVIYNKNSGQLFCSRDRFGIKPFYYIHHGEQFYFASEVKAFYDLPFFNPALNKKQVFRGLNLGWISYHDETYFEQVKALPPAHNLIFNNNTIALDSYWVLEKKELNLSYKQAVDAFKAQFLRLSESICDRMLK
jgi:asparagine synthase (glutamine-hydrolysing)